jgi:uncharacterized lipoprotein YehR (DUF1307 family)
MKKSMVTFLKSIIPVIVALVFVVAVSGCQRQEGTMEKAGKKVDKSVEKTKDAMKQAGEKVQKGAVATKEAVESAGQKAEEKAKE